MKKKIIFVAMRLAQGGTERTLVEALDVIDYDLYDVTLYSRKNALYFLPRVNKNVHVIINDTCPQYENTGYYKFLSGVVKLSKRLRLKGLKKSVERKQRNYLLTKRRLYEKKTYFSDGVVYDLAISYDMGKECAIFTDLYVDAKEKYTFLHSSDLESTKFDAFAKFDKIIGVNSGVSDNVESVYPHLKDKLAAVENFISPETITDMVDECHADCQTKESYEICTCGGLNRVKGQDVAIKAAKILSDEGCRFHWTLVGDGDKRGELEDLIRQCGLEDKVTITGFQTNPYTYMNECDVYVQPSKEEAHATTLIEALILCKPIVSTNTIAGTYILSKYPGGLLVDIDEQMLADRVRYLMENVDARQKLVDDAKSIDWEARRAEYANDVNRMLAGQI